MKIIAILLFIMAISIVFISCCLACILAYKSNKSKSHNKTHLEKQFDYLKGIPFPFVVLDNKGILKYSQNIKTIFEGTGKSFEKFITQLDLTAPKQTVCIGNLYYQVYSEDKNSLKILYFTDSDYVQSNDQSCYNKTIVSLIFIDNYDEVLEDVDEGKIPLLLASIDRKLNAVALQIGGIIKKIENDKYLFIFSLDKLEYLKNRKFDILDQVRNIEMGNKIPVTLSIGIGLDGITLNQSLENARAAIDLALGRGGDQVLIKNGDKYSFYGGKAKEVGYSSKVRARVKTSALSELIGEAENVIIMGHRNADLDCIGAAIGVCKIVSSLGKQGNIILDNVAAGIKLLYNRLDEVPEYKNKIILTSEAGLAKLGEKTLLIIVDTHRPSILESPKIYEKANKIVVFDHHRKSTEFIDNSVLTYHEPYASSTSELITEMLQYINGVKLKNVEADALLAGITVDTKNFGFKTGAKTFEAAAYLRRNGADTIRVRLLFQYDMDSYKAKNLVVSNAEIFNENIAIALCPGNLKSPSLIAAQTADELLNITGIRASFVLCNIDNVVLISARSLLEINVQIIMEQLGGGGHQTVAGAQLPGKTIVEAEQLLKQAILNYLEVD